MQRAERRSADVARQTCGQPRCEWAIGDDTLSGKPTIQGDHGLARSRLYWGQEGLANTAVSACNTFVAPPAACFS